MNIRDSLYDALCAHNITNSCDVEALGAAIADHIPDGMIHAFLRGMSKVEKEFGTPAVARALVEVTERIEKIEGVESTEG